MNQSRRVRVIGPGRAGRSLASALATRGWVVLPHIDKGGAIVDAAHDVDLCVIATPDSAIAEVAALVAPVDGVVVAHLAGSLGLDVLAPHARRAALHPLVALPDAEIGATRLLAGAWFAVAGDPMALEVVEVLGGRAFNVDDGTRVVYHAAACIASNHLVALLGQVHRIAEAAGVPFEAYLDLVRATVENVASLGPGAALTGPAARGDDATIARHLEQLDPRERPAYEALVTEARRLATRS